MKTNDNKILSHLKIHGWHHYHDLSLLQDQRRANPNDIGA